jgi:hypothetical protein
MRSRCRVSDEIQSISPLSAEGKSGGGAGARAAAEAATDMDTEPIVEELDGPATGDSGDSARDVDGADGATCRVALLGVTRTPVESRFLRLRGLGGFSGPYPHWHG